MDPSAREAESRITPNNVVFFLSPFPTQNTELLYTDGKSPSNLPFRCLDGLLLIIQTTHRYLDLKLNNKMVFGLKVPLSKGHFFDSILKTYLQKLAVADVEDKWKRWTPDI